MPRNVTRLGTVKSDMRHLLSALSPALILAALAGCASVATHITLLDPARSYAPTQNVILLLDYPPQPHVKIALIEAQGLAGGSEAELLLDARKKAQALGADAMVRVEVTAVYQPPVRAFDPWYGNPFYSRYRYPNRAFYLYPYFYGPYPYGDYVWIGGGNVQTLKAVAIKYTTADGGATKPAP
ncbi:MAG TPA: hypothetical protein VGQ88_06145, partial [Burkholderiales bacterium]|nr:hypothetical protein [Burkholderiales bacterium]